MLIFSDTMKILNFFFLLLLTIFLLLFGLISIINPMKVQNTLLRLGLNKVQKEIMGEKIHLMFLKVIGTVLIIAAILIFTSLIKQVKR
jgi:hypothetical protein